MPTSELVIFIIGLTSIVGLITYALILKNRLNHVLMSYVQLTMDNTIIKNELQHMQIMQENDEFLQFLSTTRDSAFKYIEEVQLVIKDFSEKADHIIRNPDVSPNTVIAYKKLLDMLPKDKDNA